MQKPGIKYTTAHRPLWIGLFVIKTSFVFRRASIVAIGEGKTSLNCLQGCDQKIPLSSIQKTLDQKTFSKWVQRIQLAEVKQVKLLFIKHDLFLSCIQLKFSVHLSKFFTVHSRFSLFREFKLFILLYLPEEYKFL